VPDICIHVPPVAALPTSYTISGTQDLTIVAITASLNGASAAGTWVPAVQIIDPAGVVAATFPLSTTLAAGASADVSWFRGRMNPSTTTPTVPITPIGGLYAWWDFSDTSTITADGSGNIITIADKTGNGHDVTQATPSARPSQTTVNALNAGFFNNANQQTLTSLPLSPILSQPSSVAAVFTQDIATSGTYFPGPYTGDHAGSANWIFNNGPFNSLAIQGGGSALSIGIVAPYTQQLLIGVFNGLSSFLQLNASTTSGDAGSSGQSLFTLGRGHDNAGGHTDYLNGKICEIMVFQGALTASQRALNTTYLKAKWATP
jgi:hypothetical protein